MRLACEACVLVALASVLGCNGPSAEVTIVLENDEGGALGELGALRVTVMDVATQESQVFGPFELDREQPTRLGAVVEPDRDVYVDVWGCVSVAACDPADRIARGCTDVIVVPAGTTNTVLTVEMDVESAETDGRCPPA